VVIEVGASNNRGKWAAVGKTTYAVLFSQIKSQTSTSAAF
jgi:hypothetical protein